MKKTFMYISPDFEVVKVDGNVVMGVASPTVAEDNSDEKDEYDQSGQSSQSPTSDEEALDKDDE